MAPQAGRGGRERGESGQRSGRDRGGVGTVRDGEGIQVHVFHRVAEAVTDGYDGIERNGLRVFDMAVALLRKGQGITNSRTSPPASPY